LCQKSIQKTLFLNTKQNLRSVTQKIISLSLGFDDSHLDRFEDVIYYDINTKSPKCIANIIYKKLCEKGLFFEKNEDNLFKTEHRSASNKKIIFYFLTIKIIQ